MQLSNKQRQELQSAFLEAFPEPTSLKMMLAYELNRNLSAIAGEGSLTDITFKLIETANSQGWVADLICAACNSNSGNQKLQNILQKFSLKKSIYLRIIIEEGLECEYDNLDELRMGASGITYRATTKNEPKNNIVIKTLKVDELYQIIKSNNQENLQKISQTIKLFEKEAETLSSFKHPNIVRYHHQLKQKYKLLIINNLSNNNQEQRSCSIYELELLFLVMEYVEGENLEDIVSKRGSPLKEADALHYIQQIGKALTLVHSKGVLHRDIKPKNIMVRKATNEAVLIDFGIARDFNPNVTQTHTVSFTQGYAPLEQLNPKAKRGNYTDIYGLAATLYHLLTQKPPTHALFRTDQSLDEPKKLNSDISDTVNKAILWGMELEASKRPQTVQEWLTKLFSQENPIELKSTKELPTQPFILESAPRDNLNPKEAAIAAYRKKVEEFIADDSEISFVESEILNDLQQKLRLTEEETRAVRDEVLKPFGIYKENLDKYRQVFTKLVDEQGYPLIAKAKAELKKFQEYYQLNDKDIALLEKEAEQQAEKLQRLQEAEILRQKQEKAENEAKYQEKLRQEAEQERRAQEQAEYENKLRLREAKKKASISSKVVGIDLGTTNSCIAVMEGGKPTVIANAEGFRTTPSVVAFAKNGDTLVGQIAKRQAVMNPENTFYSVKRFIGRRFDEVTNEATEVSYRVLSSGYNVKLDSPSAGKQFAPEEISAKVLRKLVEDASKYLGETVTKAVITVPAYFNDSQRQAIKDAGKIAGIEVLWIINETTAASLAYGFDKKTNETILVFDLGGGTLDVSVLEIGDGVFEVLATSGDTHLGGDNFDKKIVDFLAEQFRKAEGIDLRKDRQALQRLTEAAEKAKIELSSFTQAEINLPFITATQDGPKHLDTTLTRAKFEELCSDLIGRCRIPVENALRDAKFSKNDIDGVVLVGGSTRIPAVQNLVKRLLGKEPNRTVNLDEVVAVGAAIQAGVLAGDITDILLLEITPLSLGVETLGGVMTKIIPRNTTIPTKKSEVFSTAVDGQTNVEIHVLQGEREFANDNKSLGTFRLDGIPSAPRGVPQIEVTFDIDPNGILNVRAKDKSTGKEQSISIAGASTLDKFDVDRMAREAEQNAYADMERREKIERKNQADSLAYQAEKQLQELGYKVPVADKTKVEGLVKELREAVAKKDDKQIKKLTPELQQALFAVGSNIYQQAGGGDDVIDADFNEDGGGDDVIDADFTESK